MVLLYFLLLLGLGLAEGRKVKNLHEEVEELIWPKIHHVRATRISLTANIIEDMESWKTKHRSRIDYNNGVVKSIVKKSRKHRFGIKYYVHPQATVDQDVDSVCYFQEGSFTTTFRSDSILPDPDYFEVNDYEIINDKETVQFVNNGDSIWATYDYEKSHWIPVKYEVIEYNSWDGTKEKHEIWMFSDFSTSFNTREVFDIDIYNCTEDPTEAEDDTINSDAITKDLIFMDPENDEHVNHVFEAFKRDFSRNYADEKEHALRKSIFKKSMRRIATTNRKKLGYTLAINQFADRTPEEMKRHKGLLKRPKGKTGTVPFPYSDDRLTALANDIPTEYDARLEGLVSDVKNQDECGSCWTFGTTAAVEGALAKSNGGKLIALSNQALIDCAWPYGANGCDGGTDNAAYEWMVDHGLPTEAEYGEYLNRDGECRINNMTKKYPIRGFTDVTPQSPTAMKIALLNHGPLSVSVHVSKKMQAYRSGIFYDIECKEDLDHEITLVGYGERDGEQFWIVKNSWGQSWGVDGYMYISTRDNNCGIATEPTYVVF